MNQKRPNIWQHLATWVTGFILLYLIFHQQGNAWKADIVFCFSLLLTFMVGVYVNGILIFKFWKPGNSLISLPLCIAIATAIGVGIYYLYFDYAIDVLFPNYFFISIFSPIELVSAFLLSILIGMAFQFSYSYLNLTAVQRLVAQAEKTTIESELTQLKSSLHPHFLFNSLNNLYGKALAVDEELADNIVDLSEVLRFFVHEGTKEKTTIAKEVEMTTTLVRLYQLRLESPKQFQIESDVDGVKEKQIAPGIFLPLIENAWKHGIEKSRKNKVFVSISSTNDTIKLYVENGFHQDDVDADKLDLSSGTGISQLEKRLQLLYPNRHQLTTEQQGDKFISSLTLSWNQKITKA